MVTTLYEYFADGRWNAYDMATNTQLELAREGKVEIVLLTEGLYSSQSIFHAYYEVLLPLQLQRNRVTGYCRPIRRLEDGLVVGTDPVPDFTTIESPDVSDLLVKVEANQLPALTECNICLSPFTLPSNDSDEARTDQGGSGDAQAGAASMAEAEGTGKGEDGDGPPIRLPNCIGHYFHAECIRAWLLEKSQCPYCKSFYGTQFGNCPRGRFFIRHLRKKLPGHRARKSQGTWMMTWDIESGWQDARHPTPGHAFSGTLRTGYLPDSPDFRPVLKMFILAWSRKLMFTIGTSLTTGYSNVVIWNGIHVRTEWTDRTGFGWPAPEYLDSVTEEMRRKGITSEQMRM